MCMLFQYLPLYQILNGSPEYRVPVASASIEFKIEDDRVLFGRLTGFPVSFVMILSET